MGEVGDAAQVGILALLTLAVIVSTFFVWRDDHTWRDVAVRRPHWHGHHLHEHPRH